ncbi:aldo/keto reductase [Pedobacter steynii]
MTTIKKIQLGQNGPLVSKLGLGCMRMSSVWGGPTPDETESIATINAALDSGINFLNTGDFYGAGHNELLVGKAIKGRRDDAFISVKFGAFFIMASGWVLICVQWLSKTSLIIHLPVWVLKQLIYTNHAVWMVVYRLRISLVQLRI